MRVISLGSGSSGNALLVEAGPQGRTRILVDVGFSAREITARLSKAGVDVADLQSMLVTHEHSDHVLGLPMLMKRYKMPVIIDPRTYAAIEEGLNGGFLRTDSGKLIFTRQEASAVPMREDGAEQMREGGEILREERSELVRFLDVGESCEVGDIAVTSFPISHDAVAPCGYLLSAGGCRVCIITDSGEVTPAMLTMMGQADLLVLEANHDRERLLRGPYPYALKRRILSSTGHLSNDQAAEAVLRTWRGDGLRWLWLSHLSRTNNTPALALKTLRTRLKAANANLTQIHISVSPPTLGNVWDSTQLWHTPSLWNIPH